MTDLLPRHLEPLARELLGVMPAILIEGARQVGKSTLAQLLAAGRTSVVANLDDEPTRAALVADPSYFLNRSPDTLVVLDEIQRQPELTAAVKASIDRDRRPGRFILTGSASLLQVKGLADSLAGRLARLTLYGLSQGEAARRRDDFVSAFLRCSDGEIAAFRTEWTRAAYAGALSAGAYPDARVLSPRLRARWLDDYVTALLRRDLPTLNRQFQPHRAASLLSGLAANQAGELVKGRLARDAAIPETSITTYLDLLAAIGLTASLPPWSANLGKRSRGRPKTLIIDSALAARQVRISADQFTAPNYNEAFGRFLEGFAIAEVLRQQSWSDQDYQVFHRRTSDKSEVDLVIELADSRVIGIEVKAATSFRGDDFNGLRALQAECGDRFAGGAVLGTGATGYLYAPGLRGLPLSALWELPGADSS
ncbi:MAG: ATP-binding protein [Bifidobacteriaceae bacterium]|nr:ATP-binding protein [Bifidobacteriaceae bacterium]